MMSISGSFITGLATRKVPFIEDVQTESYEATGWIEISKGESTGEKRWSEELMRSSIGGWWIGDRTKGIASRVSICLSYYDAKLMIYPSNSL